MALEDDTLSAIVAIALPIAKADLSEKQLTDVIDGIEDCVGINTLTAIDLSSLAGGEALNRDQATARALLVSLRIFQTCLAAFREVEVPANVVLH